jgi:hypothetical protein
MSTGLVWDERFAWHDAGLGSTSLWVEPYPVLDRRPEAKRRLKDDGSIRFFANGQRSPI